MRAEGDHYEPIGSLSQSTIGLRNVDGIFHDFKPFIQQ